MLRTIVKVGAIPALVQVGALKVRREGACSGGNDDECSNVEPMKAGNMQGEGEMQKKKTLRHTHQQTKALADLPIPILNKIPGVNLVFDLFLFFLFGLLVSYASNIFYESYIKDQVNQWIDDKVSRTKEGMKKSQAIEQSLQNNLSTRVSVEVPHKPLDVHQLLADFIEDVEQARDYFHFILGNAIKVPLFYIGNCIKGLILETRTPCGFAEFGAYLGGCVIGTICFDPFLTTQKEQLENKVDSIVRQNTPKQIKDSVESLEESSRALVQQIRKFLAQRK